MKVEGETLGQRIQAGRREAGLSQENLGERLGVSRQAVSKWENGTATPDLDKILLLCDCFGVTTDHLLRGEQTAPAQCGKTLSPRIFTIAATGLDLVGLLTAWAVWAQWATTVAVLVGLVIQVLGCTVFGVGMAVCAPAGKGRAKRRFWAANVWLLAFMPWCILWNVGYGAPAAPYIVSAWMPGTSFFWLLYVLGCGAVSAALLDRARGERARQEKQGD